MQFFPAANQEEISLSLCINRLYKLVQDRTNQELDLRFASQLTVEPTILAAQLSKARGEFVYASWPVVSIVALKRLGLKALAEELDLAVSSLDMYREDFIHLYMSTLGKVKLPMMDNEWNTKIYEKLVSKTEIILLYAFATLSKFLYVIISSNDDIPLTTYFQQPQVFQDYVVAALWIAIKQLFVYIYEYVDFADYFRIDNANLNSAERCLLQALKYTLPPVTFTSPHSFWLKDDRRVIVDEYRKIIAHCLDDIGSNSNIFAQFQRGLLSKNTAEDNKLFDLLQELKGQLAHVCGAPVQIIDPAQTPQTRTMEISPPPSTPAGPSVSFSPIPPSQ
ncbi:MAG: hypothetical protein WCW01_06945 [Gammaproteobacteria bacterium]